MLNSYFEIKHDFVDELVDRRHLQVEVDCEEHLALHLEELGDAVNSIAELDVLFRLYGVDFVVLAADEQAGDAQQLEVGLVEQLAPVDQHKVDQLDAHVHRLRPDPELAAHLDQPSH